MRQVICWSIALLFAACTVDGPPIRPPSDYARPSDPGPADQLGGDDITPGDVGGDDVTPGDAGGDGTTPGDAGGDGMTPGDHDVGPGCNNNWPIPTSGVCAVSAGDRQRILLRGDILLESEILPRAELLVVNGTIACVDCSCGDHPQAAGATVLTCPRGVISAGLINAHDHIGFTETHPVPDTGERYEHRHDWRKGLNDGTYVPVPANSHGRGNSWGELRQVLAGTTSLFGSGGAAGLLRNLDQASNLEGLSHGAAIYRTFPLADSNGTMAPVGCARYGIDDPTTAAAAVAYVPHVGEGIGIEARNELLCISGHAPGGQDLVFGTAAFIHGVGFRAADIAMVAAESRGLVWSPRTNTVLYGATAEAPVYDRLGARVALGTDWTATGSVNMLRELACAESWNAAWGGYFSDADLVAMATAWAADQLGFGDRLGRLQTGKVADLVVWNAAENPGFRAVLDAGVDDVALVLRGGVPLVGEPAAVAALSLAGDCEATTVCGAARSLCTTREIGLTLSALRTAVPGAYDLFFCAPPADEPTCIPSRPGEYDGLPATGDLDGDGVDDAGDNCPEIFNPIRPLDRGEQADADGDGLGDICDPCPLDPGTTACTSFDPQDRDNDGLLNAEDSCPDDYDPSDTDGDGDLIADVCDICPAASNLGNGPCPTTIYALKQRAFRVGWPVLVGDAVVTASGATGFFMQVAAGTPSWAGPDYGGIFVFNPEGPQPAVGAGVTVSGLVGNYYGQMQITSPTVTVGGGGAAPAPRLVAPADVAPGGALAAAAEGLLVEVRDTTVLAVDPPGADGETVVNELLVTGNLSVDDYLHLIDPFPEVGQALPSIRGVLRYNWNRNKLCPRSAADLTFGPPALVAFGPSPAVVYDNDTGAVPALTVSLSPPPSSDTVVPIGTSNSALLAAAGGGVTVLAGTTSAEVVLAPSMPGGPVTLTASLGGAERTVQVTVLDSAVAPHPVSLTPNPAQVVLERSVDLTVTLVRPARPGGETVTLGASGVAVTLPAQMIIAARQLSGEFTVTAGGAAGSATITATAGGTPVSTELEVLATAPVGLVLVEVFYDPSGSDAELEWVKLYNGTGQTLELAGYSLGWGGEDYTYGTIQLVGSVAPGACFVVGGPTSSAANFSPELAQGEDLNQDLQNGGSAADGVALFNRPAIDITDTTVPIDAVLYGAPASNTNGLLGPSGAPAAVSVADAPSGQSIVRTSVSSWIVSATPNAVPCPTLQ